MNILGVHRVCLPSGFPVTGCHWYNLDWHSYTPAQSIFILTWTTGRNTPREATWQLTQREIPYFIYSEAPKVSHYKKKEWVTSFLVLVSYHLKLVLLLFFEMNVCNQPCYQIKFKEFHWISFPTCVPRSDQPPPIILPVNTELSRCLPQGRA